MQKALRGPRLVLGVHKDLTTQFARHGLPPVTVCLDRVTASHVAAVLNRRLSYFALDQSAVEFSTEVVRYLYATFAALSDFCTSSSRAVRVLIRSPRRPLRSWTLPNPRGTGRHR
jgi:hypothetical protein